MTTKDLFFLLNSKHLLDVRLRIDLHVKEVIIMLERMIKIPIYTD